MPITLNHTIVPSNDKVAAAEFIARILGLKYEGMHGHFAPVRVNDTLTLDFDERGDFERHHYAFHVDDEMFDQVLGRIKGESIPFGSLPNSKDDGKINERRGGRGFYFSCADGHSWELMPRV